MFGLNAMVRYKGSFFFGWCKQGKKIYDETAVLRQEAEQIVEKISQYSSIVEILNSASRIRAIEKEWKDCLTRYKIALNKQGRDNHENAFWPFLGRIELIYKLYFAGLLRDITKIWLESLLHHEGEPVVIVMPKRSYDISECLEAVENTPHLPVFDKLFSIARDNKFIEWQSLLGSPKVTPYLGAYALVPPLTQKEKLPSADSVVSSDFEGQIGLAL